METPDRPPDRVTFGPWEQVPGSRHETKRLVATRFSLLTVLEYREVVDETFMWQRKRAEFWDIPEMSRPVFEGSTITLTREPRQTIGRWEWEADPRGRHR